MTRTGFAMTLVVVLLSLLASPTPAPAGLIDYDPTTPGIQSARWPAGSTIMIFMDGLAGMNRTCFEDGVKSWDEVITNLTVQFKDGNRPAGMNGIQVMVVPAGSL